MRYKMKIASKLYRTGAFLAILLSSAGFTSCEKSLEEEAKTFINPDDFFTNETQCIQAVNGVYQTLYSIYSSPDYWRMVDLGTDVAYSNDVNSAVQNYEFGSGSNGTGSLWLNAYSGIKNANLVISRVAVAEIDNTIKQRILSEAKFLRALYYFNLSNTFGGVPLWTQEIDINAVSSLSRSSLADVRAQIIQDLTEAEMGLPLSYPSSDIGRVTKGAAQALLAKVYLFGKDWKNAKATALKVVNSGSYSLMTNYDQLFDVNTGFKNNKESIFEVQYLREPTSNTNTRTHSQISYYIPQRDAGKRTYAGVDFGNLVVDGWNVFLPTAKLVSMFEPGDKRKDIVLGFGFRDQKFTRFPKPGYPWFGSKFWDLNANGQSSGKNLYLLRYADVLLMLSEAENELGNTAESIRWMNMIRLRAGLPELAANTTRAEITNKIFNERAIEFVGEFQRRFDLNRWGKLVEAAKSVAVDNPVGAAKVRPFHQYYPIAQEEIIKNPNLEQNEGY